MFECCPKPQNGAAMYRYHHRYYQGAVLRLRSKEHHTGKATVWYALKPLQPFCRSVSLYLSDDPLALPLHRRAHDAGEVDEGEVRAVWRLDLDRDEVAAEPVLLALAHLMRFCRGRRWNRPCLHTTLQSHDKSARLLSYPDRTALVAEIAKTYSLGTCHSTSCCMRQTRPP